MGGTPHGLIKKDANYIILIPGKKAGGIYVQREWRIPMNELI